MTYEFLRKNNKKVIEKDDIKYNTIEGIRCLEHFNKKFHSEIEGYRIFLFEINPYIGIKLQM